MLTYTESPKQERTSIPRSHDFARETRASNVLDLVNLTPLMERTSGRPEIVIGLVDGPVVISHPDLAGENVREIPGRIGGTCARATSLACMHGTFVAGILSAKRSSAAPAICPANAGLIECTRQVSSPRRKLASVMSSSARLTRLGLGPAQDANVAPRRSTGGLFSPDPTHDNSANPQGNYNKKITWNQQPKHQQSKPVAPLAHQSPVPSSEDNRSAASLAPQQLAAAPCPTCAPVPASQARSYVYALGRIEPRFPSPAVEKEFAQVTGRTHTKGKTDREAMHAALSAHENRYLARQEGLLHFLPAQEP